MKYNLYKYCGAALCTALALMTASCSMHDDITDDCRQPESGEKQQVCVKLRLSVPSQAPYSRALDPTGGEENGEGREDGQLYENAITDALVFFYRATDNINADGASTQIDEYAHLTVSSEEGNGWVTNAVQVSLETGIPYNIIVVANPGEYLSWVTTEGSTLGGVRDHIYTNAWVENDNGYTNFVMSSEDGTKTITVEDENTSEDNPATAEVDVERLAARVDYQTNQENNYQCGDNLGSVEITGAAIINKLTAGTYLIKRVTRDATPCLDNIDYLGDELPATGGIATNYVIDPWTSDKNATNAVLSDGNTSFELPDKTKVNAAGLYDQDTYFPIIPNGADPETWADYCKEGKAMEGEGAGWKRVGYTLENTTWAENTSTNYNTGIVFKAQFHPAGVDEYKDGQTFFRYNTTIYTSLTGMMADLNNNQDFAQYVTNAIAGFNDWNDVAAFANGLTDPTGYADYLKGLVEKGTDTNFSRDGIYNWTQYMQNELGVVESDTNGPQINQGGINTRDVLFANSRENLRTYYKGQCYYIWWLRHSNNNDDTTNGVMEYAIVRNNIYKVKVSSVSTIGGDVPGSEELRAHVYVNDWVALEGETLPM